MGNYIISHLYSEKKNHPPVDYSTIDIPRLNYDSEDTDDTLKNYISFALKNEIDSVSEEDEDVCEKV